jgi:pyridoxine kinase
MARILALSSQVGRGSVGLSATVPALQHLGHEVWTLPTILLANRPGFGGDVRWPTPVAHIDRCVAAWERDGCFAELGAVFAGYFPSAPSVRAAARAIAAVKAARPQVIVFVDPILGDGGRLYVAPATAEAVRRHLLPLADIISPNRFELEWLSRAAVTTLAEARTAARRLGPRRVLVTSAVESSTEVATLLVTGAQHLVRGLPRRRQLPNGAGDVFAGLFLGRLLEGLAGGAALDASLGDLDRVLQASEGRPVLDLSVLCRRGPAKGG